jgi:maltoporin
MHASRSLPFIAVASSAALILPSARAADPELEKFKAQIEAQMKAIKAGYEARIEKLEQRINALEGDNARLKRTS